MKSIVLTGPTSMLGIALINKCIKEGTRVLAIANPGSSKIGAIPTGSDGLVNVLECCRLTASVKSVVNVTTDKVYRNNEWDRGYVETDY